MKHVLAVFLAVVAASTAFGYSGATISVIENDMTVSNATVFTVPAAAAMPGARLMYDNSALLGFSSNYDSQAGLNWMSMPLTAPGITINAITYTHFTGRPTGVNNTLTLYTNTQGVATDPRFPASIPRVGRWAGNDYTAVQFLLDQPTSQIGVFVAMNSNAWKMPWTTVDDNNIRMETGRMLWVSVLGESDTFATAQLVQIPVGNFYAPFIKVTSNGTNLIKSICVVQDTEVETGAPFGFFDVYAVSTASLPNTPSNPVPANATDNCRVNGMTLSWAGQANVTYDVYLDTNTNPTTKVASDLTAASFSPTLDNAVKYYWRVVAKNSAGSTDGPVWMFRTRVTGDINANGFVNVGDLQALVAAWGSQETPPSANWNADADCNGDALVNVGDLQPLVAHWGEQQLPW